MFVVIQKRDDVEHCIGIIQQDDQFISYVNNYTSKYGPKYIENIEINELKKNKYEDWNYLVYNNNELTLVNKYKSISRGYFYNSTVLHLDIVAIYRYIVYTPDLDKDISNLDTMTFLDYDLIGPTNFKNNLIAIMGGINDNDEHKINTIKSIVPISKEYIENSLIITNNIELYKNLYPSAEIISYYNAEIMKKYLGKDIGCIIIDNMIIPKRAKGIVWELFFFKSNKMRIMLSNNAINFTPRIKRKIDYHLFLRTIDSNNIDRMWNNIGKKVFDNKNSFVTIFDQMTYNSGIMVFKKDDNDYKVLRHNSIN